LIFWPLRILPGKTKRPPEFLPATFVQSDSPTLDTLRNLFLMIKLLSRIRELMARLGRETEFEDYLAALRVEYKRKRNFIKLLQNLQTSVTFA